MNTFKDKETSLHIGSGSILDPPQVEKHCAEVPSW